MGTWRGPCCLGARGYERRATRAALIPTVLGGSGANSKVVKTGVQNHAFRPCHPQDARFRVTWVIQPTLDPREKTMSFLGSSMNAEAVATSVGVVVALLSVAISVYIFSVQQRRLLSVEKQQTYQRLELASNELFRFAADNAGVLARFHTLEEDPSIGVTDVERVIADNHIYQTLNLFEMAARFRQAKLFEDEIFGSWVIWYYSMLESWYFRQTWDDVRANYTSEIRRIFDRPIKNFDPRAGVAERKSEFFAHVAKELKCPRVRAWLDDLAR